ncbi:hypothetical protein PV726_46730 [Streptomyces europaeiscabiei]|uniref:hypothetical protein n=1 Tax=Streptomyces europaeiscabiei TaxID=146819 RepID=UPI0029A60FFC|nr:hypothetical protein [Streptomyces europaeiscabiei]MDX3697562.1 hypothetical protein [Streptomyces europaeiscabiei]
MRLRWVHVHWRQEHSTPDEQMIAAASGLCVVVDRTHLEAAATGLLPLAQLVHDLYSQHLSHAPLAELMAGGEPAAPAWNMTPPARLTFPPAVETRTWAGAASEILLIGQPQQTPPTGLTWLTRLTRRSSLRNSAWLRGSP